MKYQLAKHISLTQVDDEAVLLDLDAGTYFGLNPVGAVFLNLLESQLSVEEAVLKIQHQYDAPAPQIQQDLNELLASLVQKRLIEVRDSA